MKLAITVATMATIALVDPVYAGQCAHWAQTAERYYSMPPGLMRAIVKHESRNDPNVLNVDGKTHKFGSATEAARAIETLTPISHEVDVGCSQITIRWHGTQFTTIGAMLDPRTNVSYASWHLHSLMQKYGSWFDALRRYHSFKEERGSRYACQVLKIMLDEGHDTTNMRRNCNF